jgi:peptidoglycan/LPS O-acetylase OafA/YrhL
MSYVSHIERENLLNHAYVMESLVIISLVLLCAIFISLRKRKVEDTFLAKDTSNLFRGVAIILLIYGHLAQKCMEGESFLKIAGNWAVIIFLFMSGISIYKTYGLSPLNKTFVINRLRKLLFPTWISLTMFYALDYLLIHTSTYTWKGVFIHYLGIIFPTLPDGPAWFITYILFLYVVYFFASIIKAGKSVKVTGMFLCCLAAFLFISANKHNEFISNLGIWKQYTFLFPTAVVIGIFGKKIKGYAPDTYAQIFLCLLLSCVFMIPELTDCEIYMPPLMRHPDIYLLVSSAAKALLLFFSLILLTLCLDRAKFYSRFLNWLGEYSFEIFLIHVPFMVYYDFFLFRKPLAAFFFVYLAMVLVLCLAIKTVTARLNLLLLK